jgi:hypothetical protein
MMIPTNGGDQQITQPRQGTHATKWPLHAQWARPAGRTALKKNSSKTCPVFCHPENVVSADHVYHAFHHNLTTKTPRSARTFFQKPQQKHHFTTAKK